MYVEQLKSIVYQDSKYNIIFTDFDFHMTCHKSKNNIVDIEDIYTACLFLSPYHLCEIAVGINNNTNWNIELMIKKRANLYPVDSYAANNGMNPTDNDLKNEFNFLLDPVVFEKTIFLKEPTLPECLDHLENFFTKLLSEKNIPYHKGDFSDKIMIDITQHFNLSDSLVMSMMFGEKEKGVLYKKLQSKLQKDIPCSRHTIKI